MKKPTKPGVARITGLVLLLAVAGQTAQSQVTQTGEDRAAYTLTTHVYKVVNDHEIKADVYRAPGEDIRPALVFIHGGALIVGSREWLSPWQMRGYVDAGFVVVSVDYRLAPETKLPGIVEDLEDAYRWLRTAGPRLFKIDPDRVAIVGHSAGGYLTLLAGFRLTPRPSALVSFYGYGDLTGSWISRPSPFYNQMPEIPRADALATVGDEVISGTPGEFTEEGRAKFYLYCRQQGIWPTEVAGHEPGSERPWFAAYEPLRNVNADYPPTLLLHGEKDTDVPFERSVAMVEALRGHKVPHEFISNSDWGHGFDSLKDDQTVEEAFAGVVKFLVERVQ